jgi:hypothetical protein
MIFTLLNLHYFRKGIYRKSLQLNYSYWGLLFWVPPTPPFLTVQTHAPPPPPTCAPQSVNLKFLLLLHNSVFSLELCVCELAWSSDEAYVAYHDEEWGVPVHDDK